MTTFEYNEYKKVIDKYLLNYSDYDNGNVSFNYEYGDLTFIKEDSTNHIILCSIYIFPEYRKKGLCCNIFKYLIDESSSKRFKKFGVVSVLSKILYNYLLRFSYKNKKFKNTKSGFYMSLK